MTLHAVSGRHNTDFVGAAKEVVSAEGRPAVEATTAEIVIPERQPAPQVEQDIMQVGVVLDEPIRPREVIERERSGTSYPVDAKAGEIPESVQEYDPKFIGAYRSPHGLAFNFFGTVQEGQEKDLEREFEVYPETIEFILDNLVQHLPNAPENPAKQAIMQNLVSFKSEAEERIFNVVIDVSENEGCLGATSQIISYVAGLCKAGGVTERWSEFEMDIPIVLSAGSEYLGLVDGQDMYGDSDKQQTETFAHEIVHGVSDHQQDNINTYREGDGDHETTAWLLGEDTMPGFDLHGATQESPHLGKLIQEKVADGTLRPVVDVVRKS